jgi:hypothetical protein
VNGGSPFYQGITSSPVSANLSKLCNDFDEGGLSCFADAGSQAQRRTGVEPLDQAGTDRKVEDIDGQACLRARN